MKTNSSPFPVTHWTLVNAVQQGTPDEAAKAMEKICQTYWFPIYAYLRRSGRGTHDAEDLTQAFFETLVADNKLLKAQRERGRLRTYLLTVLVRLLSDQGRHDRALKRGGTRTVVSFDSMEAEERYAREPQDGNDPAKIYLHAWARGLIDGVRMKLRSTFEEAGRLQMFETLEPWLGGEDKQPPYEELAETLRSTPGAVRLLVHRVRKKYRTLLEREVAMTVADPESLEEELAWLRQMMAG